MKTCILPIVSEFISTVSDLDLIVKCLTGLLALRDTETEEHTRRVIAMTLSLAGAINIPTAELIYIQCGAMLHDIGKIGIPDFILRKEGPLTKAERDVMESHPVYAYELLSPIPWLRPVLDIPYCHHEKWDGTGYPRGLKHEKIPLAARLFSVVDVWDALLSDRPYRRPGRCNKPVNISRNNLGNLLTLRSSKNFSRMAQPDDWTVRNHHYAE